MNRRKDFFVRFIEKEFLSSVSSRETPFHILNGRICPREGIKSTGIERQSGRFAFSQSFRAEKASGFLIV